MDLVGCPVTTKNPEPNLDELIASFELANRAQGLSHNTVGWYTEMLGSYLRFLEGRFGHCDLSLLTIENTRLYILDERGRPRYRGHPTTPEQAGSISQSTVQCRVRAIKAFSTFLHTDGFTEDNRMRKLKMPKASARLIRPLTPEEIAVIAGCIETTTVVGHRNLAIVNTMLDTGLRIGGVASLTTSAVDLNEDYLRTIEKGDRERIVPFGKFVQSVLRDYILRVRPLLVNADSGDYLFLSSSGKPLTVNSLKLMFSRLARRSGVTRLHAHLCRHTFAIGYLMAGGDVFSLKEILGHSSLEMVNRYLHFTNAQIRARHHDFSPMDRLHPEGGPAATSPPPAAPRTSDPNETPPEQ